MERFSFSSAAPHRRRMWRAQIRRWIGEELTGEEATAFADEAAERDIRRMRVLAPLMVALHIGHILLLRVTDSERIALTPDIVRWYDDLVRIHTATLPLAVLVTVVAYRWPTSRVGRILVPLTAAVYLIHGGLVTGVDQIALGNVAAFTGYSFGIAFVCAFPLRTALWVYAAGGTALALAMFEFSRDPALRTSNLLNGLTVVTMSLALNVLLAGARKRDFSQRRIIARQRDELASLNANLERRVNEQVGEILRRAEEVNQLNAQLRSQIRARSGELQAALTKLAEQRGDDGSLRPGVVLGDRFEVGETIGSGGMGVVYAGHDRITGATVAIKVIRPTSALGVDAMRRFLGEAGVVAAITHPAVVRMIHVDVTEDGQLYQAQELVDGLTLEQHLQEGPWPEAAAARLGAVLSDALAAAHVHGVIHRDVKPANVMLIDEAPGLKLLDFGLAKLYDEASRTASGRTGVGLVVGTPAYMAPEQVLSGDITDKADVYAVGVLMFQLLTGRLAFEIDGASRVMLNHVSVQAPDVRSIRLGVADELASIVAACLMKDSAARPTASELGARLAAFADAHAAPALEELVRLSAPDTAHAEPQAKNSGSIARRMKGLATALLLSTISLGG